MHDEPGVGGLVYLDYLYNTPSGDVRVCKWGYPWHTTMATSGRIRPLFGLYQETSATAEFLGAESELRSSAFEGWGGRRPHWFDAWHAAGDPSLESSARAAALGARWYASCDPDGNVSVTELPGVMATGVAVNRYAGEQAWHSAAVEWWISSFRHTPESSTVPVLTSDGSGSSAHPSDQAAQDVSLHSDKDLLTVHAEQAGWVWLRIPWDPDWRSLGNTPVHKGGPGHLVIWADQGLTELRWSVPRAVDAAAAAATGAALMCTAAMATVNRRRGWQIDPERRRPGTDAVKVFAAIVDGWARTAARSIRWIVSYGRQHDKFT